MRHALHIAAIAAGLAVLPVAPPARAGDLAGLKPAVERGDARAIAAWLQSPAAATAEDPLAPLAGTGAVAEPLRAEGSRLIATEDMIGLLAQAYVERPDPALRERLLALIDQHAAARARIEPEVRRAVAARAVEAPLRIARLEVALQPSPRLVATYAQARAGDRLQARWLFVPGDPAKPRPVGEREAILKAGDGNVEIPLSGLSEPGAYRVEVSGRDTAAVTLVAVAPPGTPAASAAAAAQPASLTPGPAPAPAEEARDETRYATAALVLRAAPDAKARETGRLKAGDAAHVVGALPGQDWLIVERNKVRSYAPAGLLSPERPRPPVVAAAPPRPAPPPPQAIEGEARVIDTARLTIGGRTIALAGIEGVGGAAAEQMGRFVVEQGGRLRCEPQGAGFVCRTAGGVDIAKAALVNGAARARPDAPEDYRRQEEAAKANRRGIWSNS